MKSIRRLQLSFQKEKWYYQGAAVKPWYVGVPWYACFHFTKGGKPIPIFYRGVMVYFAQDRMDVYFPLRIARLVTEYYYRRQLASSDFIYKLYQNWEKVFFDPLKHEVVSLLETDLSKLTDRELVKEYDKFILHFESGWRETIFHDAFDACGETIFEEAVHKARRTLSSSDVQLLAAPTRLSSLQNERQGILTLAKVIRQSRSLRAFLNRRHGIAELSARFSAFARKLQEHADSFHWLYNDFAIIKFRPPEKFLQEAIHLVLNPKQMEDERRKLWVANSISKRRQKLLSKLRLDKHAGAAADLLSCIAAWRDARKSYNQIGDSVMLRFAKEFSRRLGIPTSDFEYIFWWEARKFLWKPHALRKLAHQRQKGCFYVDSRPQAITDSGFYGKKGLSLNRAMKALMASKTLSGRPAYPGIVQGVARHIYTQKDFRKMKKGDILFAPNTRPEYVPIMKIAGAIVTEEGGATSHAAIVSRELHKPCIVGAQGIMSVIKDGQRVEVDADKGMVIKLSK